MMENDIMLPHDHGNKYDFDHMPELGEFTAAADVFKLIGDPTRLRLFWILCHCEECVVNLSAMMNMTSPALSHHLKLLKACGLIESKRIGKEVYYKASDSVKSDALHHMIERMAEISCPDR